jgi:Protein of unknown function (DUF4239)
VVSFDGKMITTQNMKSENLKHNTITTNYKAATVDPCKVQYTDMNKSDHSMMLLLPLLLLLLISLPDKGASFVVNSSHDAVRARTVGHQTIRTSRVVVQRQVTVEPRDEAGEKDSFPEMISQKLRQTNDLDSILWYLPPVMTVSAFMLYKDTSRAFHQFIDSASGHSFQAADGGQFASELAQNALGGPVTFGISILFGTLVGLTVSTLYTRQQNIHETLVGMSEKFRDLELCVEGFPEPYKLQCKKRINFLCSSTSKSFANGTFMTSASLEERKEESAALTLLLNSLSKEPDAPGMIVGRAFDCMTSINEKRASLISSLSTTFTPPHYINMVLLACSMLFVFLLQTDNTAMQFLLDFQLAIAWALLIGAYSLLGVVIYDLATPFSGIFSNSQDATLMVDSLRVYTDRKDAS